MRRLIKYGKVIDPQNNYSEEMDILIEKGIITKIEKDIKDNVDETLDATGCTIMPGLIDMHVHLRDPGFLEKETLHTGAQAALNGGFTSIVCMPNTKPVIDSNQTVAYIQEESKKSPLNVYVMGSITKGLQGKELSDYKSMKAQGIVGVTDDGMTVMNAKIMFEALKKAKENDLAVSVHCEDTDLIYDNTVNQGKVANELGLIGRPNISEDVIVQRDINLAKETKAHVHIQHISSKGSISLIREAKKQGVKVTCEVTPHHFTLTEEAILLHKSNAKMSPPLRSKEDLLAIHEGLKDGTIDVIATDHAPHTMSDKTDDISTSANGIVGLETSVGLAYNQLVHKGVLTEDSLVEKMSINPAKILGLKKDGIKVGAEAEISIIDPNKTWQVDASQFKSKGKNTPFNELLLKGKAVNVIIKSEKISIK